MTTNDALTGVLADIREGRLDDRLEELLMALTARNRERFVSVTWKLNLPDRSVTEHDLTIDQWEQAERLARTTWVNLDPRMSARNLKAVAVAAYLPDLSLEEAQAKVGAMSGAGLQDCLELVEVRRRPLSEGA